MDTELRLHAEPPGRNLDRVAQPRVAHVVGLRRLDEVDPGAGVGGLDVLHLGGVVRGRLRMIGHREGGVDHVGEVVREAGDLALAVVDAIAVEHHPAVELGVEVVGLDVLFVEPLGDQRRIVGERDLDVLPELGAVRGETVTAERSGRDVGHAGVERRQLVFLERGDPDVHRLVDRAGVDVEGGFTRDHDSAEAGVDHAGQDALGAHGIVRPAQPDDAGEFLAVRIDGVDLDLPGFAVGLVGVADLVLAHDDAEAAVGDRDDSLADADDRGSAAVVGYAEEAAQVGLAAVELAGVGIAHQDVRGPRPVHARAGRGDFTDFARAAVAVEEDDPQGVGRHGCEAAERVPAGRELGAVYGRKARALPLPVHPQVDAEGAGEGVGEVHRHAVELGRPVEVEREFGLAGLAARVRIGAPLAGEIAVDKGRGVVFDAGNGGGGARDEIGAVVELADDAHVAHGIGAARVGGQRERDAVAAFYQPVGMDRLDERGPIAA